MYNIRNRAKGKGVITGMNIYTKFKYFYAKCLTIAIFLV